jgi:hypothetical protein
VDELKLDRWFVRRERYDLVIREFRTEVTKFSKTIDRLYQERDDIDDDLRDAVLKIIDLEKTSAKRTVTQVEMDALKAIRCSSCGGAHTIACPRVKRMRFRPDGSSPAEVEFFPAGEWPREDVSWLEELEIEKAKIE